MFEPSPDQVGGSLALSALCGALPLVTMFVLLGGLKMKAWQAGLISLAVALVVGIALFEMPADDALLSAAQGALLSGFFPIMWIVINAVFVYNLTVRTGHFDVLRRAFSKVSDDQRIQALIIAFSFGALLEALAGFGTPVAITVVMLMALGFKPVKAAAVALIANTAPVAYGAMASPINALSDQTGFSVDTLGAMVGRQTPILAVLVPLILVFVVDGKRGLRQTWIAALTCGVAFGLAQFVASNYISVPLADIIASLFSVVVVVGLLRVWQPREKVLAEALVGAGGGDVSGAADGVSGVSSGASGDADGEARDSSREVFKAFLPYAIIIVIFVIVSIPVVKDALAHRPFSLSGTDHTPTVVFPGLSDVAGAQGGFKLDWFPAAGTMLLLSGILTAIFLRIRPGAVAATYGATYKQLAPAIVTVMAVLGLAYVMNFSGQTGSIGAWLAGAGSAFAILSPILGWLGVAVTGSDTSANALFGLLQVTTAKEAGLDPILMAASNSSGGVLGKMVSPQNLAIAAAAVGMAGKEGEIFRKVFGWSIAMLAFMCVLVALQSTPVLGWMVP
ncbi:lactate permease [Nocardioides luteus]|uniref:L-lactate permease n=1 Tax=Nocardioides luteus TaxID=1844 RepID=A0ABQ5T0S9_9ACTN|nr:L-lactate permease [Nocardioides luteus]MDR7310345.1 lactate permease [Nocardioides luteus]GGR53297.1 L-lactate permease [Nocardioides luteus]GLJ69875.1 L-lactate permease [Nocardioides luteus]